MRLLNVASVLVSNARRIGSRIDYRLITSYKVQQASGVLFVVVLVILNV